MTIIGVTGESSKSKIDGYIKKNRIQYPIALGAASRYSTRSIPHGWLIGASGKVVWAGNPGHLTASAIEDELKQVRAIPAFEVPPQIKNAKKYVRARKIAKAMAALEKYIEKPKDRVVAKRAEKALKKMKRFAKNQLREVKSLEKKGDYAAAYGILNRIASAYKNTEYGDKASDEIKSWKRDKIIKKELQGSTIIEQAADLIFGSKKEQAKAIALIRNVAKGKKFTGTKAQKKALKLLDDWE